VDAQPHPGVDDVLAQCRAGVVMADIGTADEIRVRFRCRVSNSSSRPRLMAAVTTL
jgi:hypothetical protein